MSIKNLLVRLQDILPKFKEQNEIELYVESKNPTSAADVENYMKQYIYQQQFMRGL